MALLKQRGGRGRMEEEPGKTRKLSAGIPVQGFHIHRFSQPTMETIFTPTWLLLY
jgi:hypothetical protein